MTNALSFSPLFKTREEKAGNERQASGQAQGASNLQTIDQMGYYNVRTYKLVFLVSNTLRLFLWLVISAIDWRRGATTPEEKVWTGSCLFAFLIHENPGDWRQRRDSQVSRHLKQATSGRQPLQYGSATIKPVIALKRKSQKSYLYPIYSTTTRTATDQ